jgi:hypothetical protein
LAEVLALEVVAEALAYRSVAAYRLVAAYPSAPAPACPLAAA